MKKRSQAQAPSNCPMGRSLSTTELQSVSQRGGELDSSKEIDGLVAQDFCAFTIQSEGRSPILIARIGMLSFRSDLVVLLNQKSSESSMN
jgi:hypothetical protein